MKQDWRDVDIESQAQMRVKTDEAILLAQANEPGAHAETKLSLYPF